MARHAPALLRPAAPRGQEIPQAIRIPLVMMVTVCLILSCMALAGVPDTVVFYIAANGNDSWSGKLAGPNTDKTDGPFASPQHARDVVRNSLAAGIHPSVQIRGGTYRFDSALLLDSKDSGSQERHQRVSPGEGRQDPGPSYPPGP